MLGVARAVGRPEDGCEFAATSVDMTHIRPAAPPQKQAFRLQHVPGRGSARKSTSTTTAALASAPASSWATGTTVKRRYNVPLLATVPLARVG
ncbi:hypothetical protein CGRA01v4_14440 [Colletotrichum graminicola]|nr:hypothetical protein CGRA01v4_14440 [Colletotrichum graminicola]